MAYSAVQLACVLPDPGGAVLQYEVDAKRNQGGFGLEFAAL
jgi:hypothetical protein